MEEVKKKRQWFYAFLDYRQRVAKGSQYIAIFDEYFPLPIMKGVELLTTFLMVKVAVDGNWWHWIFVGGISYIGIKALLESIRIIIAHFYFKTGMWKAEIDWGAKKEKYNTYSLEQIHQFAEHTRVINAIAEKLEIKERAENKFKEI